MRSPLMTSSFEPELLHQMDEAESRDPWAAEAEIAYAQSTAPNRTRASSKSRSFSTDFGSLSLQTPPQTPPSTRSSPYEFPSSLTASLPSAHSLPHSPPLSPASTYAYPSQPWVNAYGPSQPGPSGWSSSVGLNECSFAGPSDGRTLHYADPSPPSERGRTFSALYERQTSDQTTNPNFFASSSCLDEGFAPFPPSLYSFPPPPESPQSVPSVASAFHPPALAAQSSWGDLDWRPSSAPAQAFPPGIGHQSSANEWGQASSPSTPSSIRSVPAFSVPPSPLRSSPPRSRDDQSSTSAMSKKRRGPFRSSLIPKKKHRCTFAGCDQAFLRPSALRGHERTHTKEAPFVCPVPECARRFNIYSNLVRHMKTHPEVDFEGVFLRDFPDYRLKFKDGPS